MAAAPSGCPSTPRSQIVAAKMASTTTAMIAGRSATRPRFSACAASGSSPGEGDADVIEWAMPGGSGDPEELPGPERAHHRQQRREWSAPHEHDPEREGGGDDGEEDAEREL